MSDLLSSFADSPTAPARRCFQITPHDINAVDPMPKALRAPSDGTIMLRAANSDSDVAHPVRAGEIVAVRVSHVRATGTTVTGAIMGYA
ncbi:spike base protein, RCAP_Rcc01079 family [Sphingobium sp. CAP-1]|uniref:spike base protein, RCAP_Rcc01079 family n=1 Tax=Sphingobium sp. CAP-1 TaxID=2676077 RepID=UPI0018AD1FE6|nr:hypothetical protein [Sphingobium sp. CAP-1]